MMLNFLDAIDRTWYNTALNFFRECQTMKNVDMKVEGTILTIKVDLSKEFGPSKSGKTVIIASTEGNVKIPEHEDKKVGLNVYRGK
jgi:hypothetical protein